MNESFACETFACGGKRKRHLPVRRSAIPRNVFYFIGALSYEKNCYHCGFVRNLSTENPQGNSYFKNLIT